MALRMANQVFGGIETGGTKILARLVDFRGRACAEGRWPTTTPQAALEDLVRFITGMLPAGGRLAALGMAAFGPVVRDTHSPHYGRVLSTPKPGWAYSNLRAALAERFAVPVVLEHDVTAAALAEWQSGAGQGMRSLAYVTVGTGIGAGLLIDGRPLEGALHPEIGHLRLVRRAGDTVPSVCPFHADCAEGLVSGPAIARRLDERGRLADDPQGLELVADYLGNLAAALVLAWSPQRIVMGGGVMATPQLLAHVRRALTLTLSGYEVGEQVRREDFCVQPAFADSGLEGALLLAQVAASAVPAPP
ncbi:MAG: ROK family protein [Gammaproteobacteria bacterium]|nr:ROK family protein [Gammaproteobacteria bacterium]